VENLIQIPIVGRIATLMRGPIDFPIYIPEENVSVDQSKIPDYKQTDHLYALKIWGDSLENIDAKDGDFAIIKHTEKAKNGELVVVSFPEYQESSLIRYYRESDHIRLEPVSPDMESIIVDDPSSLQIEGKLVLIEKHRDTEQSETR